MHVSRLRQNLDEIVVGQEVEPREGGSLCSKVVFETLLNVFQLLVLVLESLVDLSGRLIYDNLRVLLGPLHVLFPELVDSLERLGLSLELRLDIFGAENVFEVHPLTLESEPLVNGIRHVAQLVKPLLDLFTDLVDVAGAHHGTHLHNIVFKLCDHFFYFFDDVVLLRVTVGKD